MIERMQREIDKNGVEIESDLQRSVGETMVENENKFTPLIRLLASITCKVAIVITP